MRTRSQTCTEEFEADHSIEDALHPSRPQPEQVHVSHSCRALSGCHAFCLLGLCALANQAHVRACIFHTAKDPVSRQGMLLQDKTARVRNPVSQQRQGSSTASCRDAGAQQKVPGLAGISGTHESSQPLGQAPPEQAQQPVRTPHHAQPAQIQQASQVLPPQPQQSQPQPPLQQQAQVPQAACAARHILHQPAAPPPPRQPQPPQQGQTQGLARPPHALQPQQLPYAQQLHALQQALTAQQQQLSPSMQQLVQGLAQGYSPQQYMPHHLQQASPLPPYMQPYPQSYQPQPGPPPGMAYVLQHLQAQCAGRPELALAAVRATYRPQQSEDRCAVRTIPAGRHQAHHQCTNSRLACSWADAAAMWLVNQQSQDSDELMNAEAAHVAAAMADSLRDQEAKAAQAAARPMDTWPASELQSHFATSVLLQKVRVARQLLQADVRLL